MWIYYTQSCLSKINYIKYILCDFMYSMKYKIEFCLYSRVDDLYIIRIFSVQDEN